MAIDILMHLCILKFINLAPCLFVIFFDRVWTQEKRCAQLCLFRNGKALG